MKSILDTIQGCEIVLFRDEVTGLEIVEFVADMDIDCDGLGGNSHGDPYFQPDTRLHFEGKALVAEDVPYVVVPPVILAKTKGVALGSLCVCTNTRSGASYNAVVGDSGPTRKIGEGSPALATRLQLDPNPNHGGTSDHIIRYRIYVGQPARVDGITYTLQPA